MSDLSILHPLQKSFRQGMAGSLGRMKSGVCGAGNPSVVGRRLRTPKVEFLKSSFMKIIRFVPGDLAHIVTGLRIENIGESVSTFGLVKEGYSAS